MIERRGVGDRKEVRGGVRVMIGQGSVSRWIRQGSIGDSIGGGDLDDGKVGQHGSVGGSEGEQGGGGGNKIGQVIVDCRMG